MAPTTGRCSFLVRSSQRTPSDKALSNSEVSDLGSGRVDVKWRVYPEFVLIFPLLYLLYDHPVCMLYYRSGKNWNTFLIASLSIALIGFPYSWRISFFWSVVYHQSILMALEFSDLMAGVKYGSFVVSNLCDDDAFHLAKRSLDFLIAFPSRLSHSTRTSFVRSQPMSI